MSTRPTYESLVKHWDTYGLDRGRKRVLGRGKVSWEESNYKSYSTLREDTLFQIAKAALTREDYLRLVERYGGERFVKQAIKAEGWDEEDDED